MSPITNTKTADRSIISRWARRCLTPVVVALREVRRRWEFLKLQRRLGGARQRRTAGALTEAAQRPVTLFLVPEAGLEPFYASHVILARVLADAGHPVLILSCNGLQPICSLKLAMNVAPTMPGDAKNIACLHCRPTALTIGAQYGLPDISIEELLGKEGRAEVERIAAANTAAPWNAVYDGIAIGSGCLGETLRAQRKVSIDELNGEDIALLHALLYSSLAIYIAVKKLGARMKIARIAYFNDYAYFLAPQAYAARNGIPLANVCHAYHRDTDRRYLNLWPCHAITHQHAQVRRWKEAQPAALDPKIVADIADGALFRLYGHGGVSTYSPNWSATPGDLLKELGLPSGGKLLVAYTNSTDELVCHQHTLHTLGEPFNDAVNPFPDQLAWLRQLVTWVGERNDLRLVVRLHPRMAVSGRHRNRASEYTQLQELFETLPPNVAVVWPESPISSYNLAELADVAVTAWSSIGLELARFGVPVIAAFQKIGPFPKSDFIEFEENAAGYFAAIARALARQPRLAPIVDAFRWTHFLHWTPLIDIADVVPQPDYAHVPPFRTPRNARTIIDVMVGGADIAALNMSRLPKGPAAAEAERRAVIAALEQFLLYFMTGRVEQPRGLRVDTDTSGTGPVVMYDHDANVTLIDGDLRIERRSPLAARLASVLEGALAQAK